MAPLLAIIWAQWRTSNNFYLRANKGGLIFKWLMGLAWYGVWALAGVGAGFLASGRIPMSILERALPGGLFLVFFFWQLFPIILASQGAFIDMRRLLVYPIPANQLFVLEVALRFTTAIEMMLISIGLLAGLSLNPEVPMWGPIAVIVFMALNLLISTGLKALLDRLFKKKGVREALMFVFLGLILVPQLFALSIQEGVMPDLGILRRFGSISIILPWTATSRIALGHLSAPSIASLVLSTLLAYGFARWQFSYTLRLDDESGAPESKPESSKNSWMDRASRWPSLFFADPIAALVEKDIRSLIRAPRFRLIFLMASSFGAVLWLPQAMRSKDGWMAQNYITMATLYGMLVLGDVLYWNVFGFERASAQQWFVTPIRFQQVLRAKNVVAVLFTFAAMAVVCAIAAVTPVSLGWAQFADALAAAAVFLVWVIAGGNLSSVYLPRPMNAQQAWRNSSGKAQFMLLLAYPALSVPVILAQLARWATGSYWAYHVALAVAFAAALCFYSVASETAEDAAVERKEQIVAALSHDDGPVSLNT